MKIEQFLYNGDNLGYLLMAGNRALAIDGGAVDDILAYVQESGLCLAWVTNTHGHGDHTTGTRRLAAASGASYLDHRRFVEGQQIDLDGHKVTVRLTPGHTMDSVCFAADDFLVTGDTLFNGTVGNCFSGDLRAFFESVSTLMRYPGSTRIFAGHDYVMDALAFARQLTPDNAAIDAYADRYDENFIVSTLEDELAVNPYLRFNDAPIIALLKDRHLAVETAYQRWQGIMSID